MRKKIECNCRMKKVLENSSISQQYPQTINLFGYSSYHQGWSYIVSVYLWPLYKTKYFYVVRVPWSLGRAGVLSEREAEDACRSHQAGRAVSARRSDRGKCCSEIPNPAGEPLLVTASHVIASGINDVERMEHVIYKLSVEDKEALANARKSKWDNNQDVPGNEIKLYE